jgi:AcrR family transcriptional regulator
MSTSHAYHHGNLRAALLETTRAILAEGGVEGLSLREVSRRTGVSHAAAYNHFRDKASLVRAVVDGAFQRLAADMRGARSGTSDRFEALRRIGVAYVRFAYQNRTDFKIMFRPELCAMRESQQTRDEDDGYRLLVEAIAECQAAGAIAPGPAEPLVLAAWSMVHGLSSLIVDGPDPSLAPNLIAAETLARTCIDALIHGLSAPDSDQASAKRSSDKTSLKKRIRTV